MFRDWISLLRIMNVDPRPGCLGEFVLHVVGLVQVELQVQAVVRASHCHRLHLHMTHVKANIRFLYAHKNEVI